jgi:arsenite methyltransferase
MTRGEYGYDAPYALVTFGSLTIVSGLGAVLAWWRKRAIAEGFRVLKPGGRMVIADIRATALYADALRTLGAPDVKRQRLGWRFWWGNPVAATTLLTASKHRI